ALADETRRWPNFTPFSREKGFHAVSAVPMRLRASVIGALNLFSTDRRALAHDDVAVAQALADIATIGIIQERSLRDTRTLAGQLETALESRIVIEQAKGVVAERAGVSVDAAFQRIRRYSRDHNRRLTDVARNVVDGSLRADALMTQ
ncbi:MAG TPA: ANTAR domain-containing protein, partial [Acidimicrobiia bacterium]|nr:ANTAR domain-containing protein [Acidimicrobiia bacterium]